MRASGIAGPLQNPPRGSEDLVEHCLLEETRLGVPLTRVVRRDQGDGRQGGYRPMAELWRRGGNRVSGCPPRPEAARRRDAAAGRRAFRSSDPLAVSNEPRTLPARDDLRCEPFQVVRWHRDLLCRIT